MRPVVRLVLRALPLLAAVLALANPASGAAHPGVSVGPSIIVTQSGGGTSVIEGTVTDTLSIALARAPASPVTITPRDADRRLVFTPGSVTFTASNWASTQVLAVAQVDDDVRAPDTNGAIVEWTVTTKDDSFHEAVLPSVHVALHDDDEHGIALVASGVDSTVTEGGAGDTLDVRLLGRPTSSVSVTIEGVGLTSRPAVVTFTPANWYLPQVVTVRAVDDPDVNGNVERMLVATTSSSGDAFDGIVDVAPVNVLDDDEVGLVLEHTDGSTTVYEGSTGDHVLVRLAARPSQPVTVTLTGQGVVATRDTVVFTSDTWNVPSSVYVTATIDELANGARTKRITARASSPSTQWNGIAESLVVDIHDEVVLRGSDPVGPLPIVPTSPENRAPQAPTFELGDVWRGSRNVKLEWSKVIDPDGDEVFYRVLFRDHRFDRPRPGEWRSIEAIKPNRIDAGPISPGEQRCFKVIVVDSFGEAANTPIRCTHGMWDDRDVLKRHKFYKVLTDVKGVFRETLSEAMLSGPAGYYTGARGERAEFVFRKCGRCGSVKIHQDMKVIDTVSLRGSGVRIVKIPLLGQKQLSQFGFTAVDHRRPVRFDGMAIVREVQP